MEMVVGFGPPVGSSMVRTGTSPRRVRLVLIWYRARDSELGPDHLAAARYVVVAPPGGERHHNVQAAVAFLVFARFLQDGCGRFTIPHLDEHGVFADDQGRLRKYQPALPGEYSAYVGFEAEARSVHNYESLFIPGLLQTEDYARAVITGTLPTADEPEIGQRVQVRLERQQLLEADEPLELWAVIDEAAVRRLVGGRRVMEAQVTHLTDMTHRPGITVQVIPYEAGAHPGMPGSFVYMEFKDRADPDLVYIDTMAGDLFLESETDLRQYATMFDHLRAAALSPGETLNLLTSVRGKYRGTPVAAGSKGG